MWGKVERLVASWSRDVLFGPVPDWLSAPVDAALADLQQPTPIEVRLGFDPSTHTLWVSETGERGRAGFCAEGGESDVELLVEFADWVQEQFFVETRGAWAQARPACPGHSHPAQAVEIAGEAWWVCPVDGRRLGMIGRLGQ